VTLTSPSRFSRKYLIIPGSAQRRARTHFAPAPPPTEILQVLKLLVVQGVQACNLGVAILAEELDRTAANPDPKT